MVTGYLSGGITGVRNVFQPTPSSYQYFPWTSIFPLLKATDYSVVSLGKAPFVRPDTGLTYTFTPAPPCSATRGAGLLTDSTTVCYGSTVSMIPWSEEKQ